MTESENSHTYPIVTSEGLSLSSDENVIAAMPARIDDKEVNLMLFLGFKQPIYSRKGFVQKAQYYDIPGMTVDEIDVRGLGSGKKVNEYLSEFVLRFAADEKIFPNTELPLVDYFPANEYYQASTAESVPRIDKQTLVANAKIAGKTAVAAAVVAGVVYLARRTRERTK